MTPHAAPHGVENVRPIPLLTFGSDLSLRTRLFVPASFSHPAKLHLGLLQYLIDRYTQPGEVIADPMCGIGSILLAALSGRHVIARDVEPRWLDIARANVDHLRSIGGLFVGEMDVGEQDARQPWGYRADCVLFSPPYGNEASSSPLAHRALTYHSLREGDGKAFYHAWKSKQVPGEVSCSITAPIPIKSATTGENATGEP